MPSKPYAAVISGDFLVIAETLVQQGFPLFPIKPIIHLAGCREEQK